MSVDEFLYWLWRIFLVLIFGLVAIIILFFLIPQVDANELRADLLAARIAHNGGFHESPGVINPALFTQETADAAVQYESAQGSEEIRTLVGARTFVADAQGEVLLEPIYYHETAFNLLYPRRERSEVALDTRILPVLLGDTPAYLHIEIVYENDESRERTPISSPIGMAARTGGAQ